MDSNSILTRKSDKKQFHFTYLAHWSDIRADDGETDSVKWLGGNEFVSADKGHVYQELS